MGGGLWLLTGLCALAAGALAFFARLASKGDRKFQPGRVAGVTGRKGHGKSLLLAHEQLRHIGVMHYCVKCTRFAGRGKVFHPGRVASNTTLRVEPSLAHLVHRVTCWDDVLLLAVDEREAPEDGNVPEHWYLDDEGQWIDPTYHATLLVLDEVHMDGWAPARQGEQLPPLVSFLLAQIRKYVWEGLWACQHESRVSLGLKVQTDEFGLCRRGYFRQMTVRWFDFDDAAAARRKVNPVKPNWVYRYRVSSRLADAYNTFQLIRPAAAVSDEAAEAIARRRGAAASPRDEGGRPPARHRPGSLSTNRPPSPGKLSTITPNTATPAGSIQLSRADPTGVSAHDSTPRS